MTNPKMQKPVSKECEICGFEHPHRPIDRKKALELAKSIRESEEAPKLTPIDKGMLIGFHNPITPILALADKVNEIINLINGETE